MGDKNVKLTVDTSQAQMSIQGLNTAWVNASAKLNVVGKVLDSVASTWAGLNKAIQDSARFMDAVKTESGVASVQMAMDVTNGQIKPMELARQQNILMQGSLRLTQEQFDLVAKSAVALADATGGDAGAAFADLSRSLVTGSTRSLAQFGIQIEDSGTKADKTKNILNHLTTTYGKLQVGIDNADDANEKYNNTLEMQKILAARSLDSISQLVTKLKGEAVEGFASIGELFTDAPLTKMSQAADTYKKLGEQSLENQREVSRLALALVDPEINKTKNAKQRLEMQTQYAKKLAAQQQIETQIISYASKWNFELGDIFRRRVLIEKSAKNQAEVEKIITKENEKQNKILGEIELKRKENDAKVEALLSIAAEDDARDKARREAAIAAAVAAEKEKQNRLKELAVEWRDYQLKKYAQEQQDLRDAKRKEMEDAWAAETRQDDIDAQSKDLRRQWANEAVEKEIADRKAQTDRLDEEGNKAAADAYKADLALRESYVAKSKELVEGLATVSINAIFAEKKAREGLSRTDYVLKQLAAYMKGEALKYAAKSLGYLAEGIAATSWNPPAAAAAFKASAVSAAASVAFGGGAVAVGAMGGNAKSSSSKGSGASSASTQRETVGGTTAQRANVTIVVGERAVLLGTMDDLMRTINGGLNDARRRGVI